MKSEHDSTTTAIKPSCTHGSEETKQGSQTTWCLEEISKRAFGLGHEFGEFQCQNLLQQDTRVRNGPARRQETSTVKLPVATSRSIQRLLKARSGGNARHLRVVAIYEPVQTSNPGHECSGDTVARGKSLTFHRQSVHRRPHGTPDYAAKEK